MKKITIILLLFLALPLPAMAAEGISPVQDRNGVNTAELRLLLNSFTALGEGHVEKALRGLQLMASTDEVRSGEWEEMKGLLGDFAGSGVKAAAVWFVRPDGSYYTTEKGLTGLNLSDRPYFPGLMAGGEVTGDLVLSKSTGNRTAIVAVPVKQNGKIIGAVGASLSVADISRAIEKEMGLPGDMFFYALDQNGRTSLHKVSALLFAYPSDMGSKSLGKTVEEMLARPEGTVTYDFYGQRTVVFKKSPLTGWVFAIGVVTGKPGEAVTGLPPILAEVTKDIKAELDKMDKGVAGVAAGLSGKDLKTAGTRRMLGDLCRSHPYAVDCAVVDRSGRMVIVEPGEYVGFEGSNISAQAQIIRLRQSKEPVLSNAFRAVEGFDAVDLEHPFFSSSGKFEGSVSMLIRPEALLSDVIIPVLSGMPVEAFVMQTDGRILYDEDREEIGRMLFEDPTYKPFPQLRALGTLICREKTGSGSYEFKQRGSNRLVTKDAHWTTVGLHGTQWRVVVMHVRAGRAGSSESAAEAGGTTSSDSALRVLAEKTEIKTALGEDNKAEIREIFRHFYSEHARLYSIQWLDAGGTNRYGYPEENSLIDVDMKTAKTASAETMLKAFASKKESTFDSPLVEGKTGTFFMVPVYDRGHFLGMIYTIRLKK